MAIRKVLGCFILLVGVTGVYLLWIDLLWSEPLETPSQFQEITLDIGLRLLILLTLWIGFRLFMNEDQDIQTLELNQKIGQK